MAAITTRQTAGTGATVAGVPLTNTQIDTNFINLNTELTGITSSKSANTIYAAPNGSAGVPTFRALVAADVPTLNQNTTGNAGTVTNGVYTTGSYADPSWITSLAKSKVGLGNVENTTLSTWSGSTNITTIGAATATSLSVTGNLTVNGTTTTVNSTTVTLDDPIITLGGDTAPTVDDNKDRGIEFRWHNGTSAKIGFFGYDDSTGYLTFIPDATNTSEVFSGTQGDVQASNFRGALIGNASTATIWQTARTVTIGLTGKSVDGSAAVSWTLAEIGAYAATNPSGYTSNVGTVISVGGTGIVSGLSLSGTVTTTGNLTLGGTLSVAASNFASQTANTVLIAPNGSAGVPTFRALVAADIPTLNQNTTGTAAGLSTTLAVTSGGTGATTLTLNNILLGNGTSVVQTVAPGTSGNVLSSNGTTWVSSTPSIAPDFILISQGII